MPPQDLLPDICQRQGSGAPRHRTPFCSWLGFAPRQGAKPACPAPHPDCPLMSPAAFSDYSSVHHRPSFALVLLFQLHVPAIFVQCFPSALALQRSYQATRKGLNVCHQLHSKDPKAFWATPGLRFHAHSIMNSLLVQGLKVQIQKIPSRELLQPARHSREGPHISHWPWLPKRTFRPSDIESQTSIQEAAKLEEKGRKRKKGETKQK